MAKKTAAESNGISRKYLLDKLKFTKLQAESLLADPNILWPETIKALQDSFSCEDLHRGCWEIDATTSVTLAHISICIHEDIEQTLADLALRVSIDKQIYLGETAEILCKLRNSKRLIHFIENENGIITQQTWTPGAGTANSLILQCTQVFAA